MWERRAARATQTTFVALVTFAQADLGQRKNGGKRHGVVDLHARRGINDVGAENVVRGGTPNTVHARSTVRICIIKTK